jgi:hypothetical protein
VDSHIRTEVSRGAAADHTGLWHFEDEDATRIRSNLSVSNGEDRVRDRRPACRIDDTRADLNRWIVVLDGRMVALDGRIVGGARGQASE